MKLNGGSTASLHQHSHSQSNPLKGASEQQKILYKKFERALTNSLDSFSKQVNVALQRIEGRLKQCERNIQHIVCEAKDAFDSDLSLAEVLVNKELRSKIIMSQWTNKFLAATEQKELDPITFAISRFCLNVALSYKDVTWVYLHETNTHKHLIHFISMQSQLIAGPALIALTHISLYQEMKRIIVSANALPSLLQLLAHSTSKPLLALATKLLSSLALEPFNKPLIAQTGCLHALYDLVLGNHVDIDESIQFYTLTALVNCLHKSDANRLLSIELKGLKPLLTLMQTTSNHQLIINSIRIIANISYNNPLTANQALLSGVGEVLVDLLEAVDVSQAAKPSMVKDSSSNINNVKDSGAVVAHSILSALSNMCNSETNQTHIGNMKGIIEAALRIVQHSSQLFLATEGANFLLACCYNNVINKSRVASRGGCFILATRISQQVYRSTREDWLCAERCAMALASVLKYKTTHEAMFASGGLQITVDLVKVVSETSLLTALGKVLVSLVPSPDELLRLHQDNTKSEVEKAQTIQVLKKVKFKGYPDSPVGPDWLEAAIGVLSMSDYDLAAAAGGATSHSNIDEFVTMLSFCKEFVCTVQPDTTVYEEKDFSGLLFSIY